jgi:hypothetical protein
MEAALAKPATKAVVVCVLVLVLIVMSSGGARSGRGARSSTDAQQDLATRALIREAAQWSTIAQQDSNPMLAVIHASFGQAYLNVARRLHTDAEIEAVGSVKVEEFSATLHANQQQAVQKLLAMCPMSSPAGIAALQTGWIS